MCTSLRSVIVGAIVLSALMLAAGCSDLVGYVAGKVPGGSVDASYKGLQKQTVGIMVWADRGITIDHPTIKVDLAHRIQEKLKMAQDANIDELKGVVWVKAEKIAKFQDDHPELEGEDIDKIAPMLPPVTRLIYVEVTNLEMHPSDAVDLWRGAMSVNIKVCEVTGDKSVTKSPMNDISVVYPEKSSPEGVTGLDDDEVYRETMNEMSKEIASRFVTHEADAQ